MLCYNEVQLNVAQIFMSCIEYVSSNMSAENCSQKQLGWAANGQK
jgi:hypothetical protein